MSWLLLVMVVACKHPAPPLTDTLSHMPTPQAPAAAQLTSVEPGVWTDGWLNVVIPPTWQAWAGPSGTALLLRVTEPQTGATVELWSFARSGPPRARPRPDCEPMLDDPGRYRAVPVLPNSASSSCVEASGAVTITWYGVLDDRELHVEAQFAPSAAFAGRLAIEPFLRDISL